MMHDYTQELFEHFNESQDIFAEVLKSQQQEVILSLKNILEQAKITELESVYMNEISALHEIQKDLNLLKNQLYHARGLSDVDANYTLATLLDEELLFLDKHLWFIEAMKG
jgi:DNA-binding ferritin-like protein